MALTLVFYHRTTRRCDPEDNELNLHRREDLKSREGLLKSVNDNVDGVVKFLLNNLSGAENSHTDIKKCICNFY